MIWTKEAPTKPGKYVARYKDDDTGRVRYIEATVEKFGSLPFLHGIPYKYRHDIHGRVEYSKRAGNAK